MDTSLEINLLVEALNKFQSEVVTVERSTTNPFFRSKYADLCSIMIESQPILTQHELAISQFPDHVDGRPGLTTVLMHTSGQFVRATVPLPISKVTTSFVKNEKTVTEEGYDPQEFGRAITYMRRYGYAAVLQIVIDEDDDGNASSKRLQVAKPIPSNPETITSIRTIWTEGGGTLEKLEDWVKKNNNGTGLGDLTGDRQQAMLLVLESKKAEREAKATANLNSVAGELPTRTPQSDDLDVPVEIAPEEPGT